MAANVFNITQEHNNARLSLHGDMSIAFNNEVSNNFQIRLFTSTYDLFSLDSDEFQFKDIAGNLVNGLIFGGKPGLFIELMFDPEERIWYITANNLVSLSGGDGVDESEKELIFAALPEMTVINYQHGKNYRGKLTANAKLANPIGMNPGDSFKIIIEQGTGGNKTLTFDRAYSFYQAISPSLSTIAGKIDVLTCYMTADRTIITELKNDYSVIRPLAYVDDFVFTMQAAYDAAQAKTEDGQTVRVIRDGWRSESNGSIGFQVTKPLNLRVQGVPKADNTLPQLRLDKSDRPAFGKALINIERGTNIVVENLGVAGASAYADGNGTGVLINANVNYALLKNLHLLENENGVRSNFTTIDQTYDLIDVLLERNGWAANPAHEGQSHSIYAGEGPLWRATRCTFASPQAGHNIKSRAKQLVLNQVYSYNSRKGRDMDIPDQGIVHATDCVFWKNGDAGQNNLIGIGHETKSGSTRPQEYFFINCYFHNDVDILREVTYVENLRGGGGSNTVPVHFIDCEFGGKARLKGAGAFLGPYTITLTGGPTGPRVPVGDSRYRFNPANLDPNRSKNPAGIAETPFEDLPPMTALRPTPPYPTFIEPLPPIPPLPDFEGNPGPDVTPPLVNFAASTSSITTAQTLTLTATAADNVGVVKVELYKNNTLTDVKTIAPFTWSETFTTSDTNGTYTYSVKAYDAADNVTTSPDVSVVINIPVVIPVQPIGLDSVTQDEFDAAVASAAVGAKRIAGAEALKTAFAPDHTLRIYQDGQLILPIEYPGGMTVVNDGTNVKITLGIPDSAFVVKSGVLTEGTWTFTLSGGASFSRTLSGSVGAIGSSSNIELSTNPSQGQGFEDAIAFIIPRSIDGLTD